MFVKEGSYGVGWATLSEDFSSGTLRNIWCTIWCEKKTHLCWKIGGWPSYGWGNTKACCPGCIPSLYLEVKALKQIGQVIIQWNCQLEASYNQYVLWLKKTISPQSSSWPLLPIFLRSWNCMCNWNKFWTLLWRTFGGHGGVDQTVESVAATIQDSFPAFHLEDKLNLLGIVSRPQLKRG